MTSQAIEQVLIKSSQTSACLTLSDWDGDYFTVAYTSPAVSALRRVHRDYGGLSSMFRKLAKLWRGWEGTSKWGTWEGDFEISCTHDGRGHVFCDFTLADDVSPQNGEEWSVTGEIVLDVGQLDAIASQLQKFFGEEDP